MNSQPKSGGNPMENMDPEQMKKMQEMMKPENMVNLIRQMTGRSKGEEGNMMGDSSMLDGIMKNLNIQREGGSLLQVSTYSNSNLSLL
jgi:hypothetical protein